MDNCASVNATNPTAGDKLSPPKQIHENYSLNLICRDDTSLNFNIDLHTVKTSQKFNVNQSTEIKATTSSSPITSAPSSLEFTSNGAASNEMDLKSHQYGTLFVVKVNLAKDEEKIYAYLVS